MYNVNEERAWLKFRAEANAYVRNKERKVLDAWCKEAKLDTPIGYFREYDKLTIYTDHPGYLLGKGGELFDKYRKLFGDEFGNPDIGIIFVEIKTGFANY